MEAEVLANIVKNDENKMDEDVPKLSQQMESVSVSELDETQPLPLDHEPSENEKNESIQPESLDIGAVEQIVS